MESLQGLTLARQLGSWEVSVRDKDDILDPPVFTHEQWLWGSANRFACHSKHLLVSSLLDKILTSPASSCAKCIFRFPSNIEFHTCHCPLALAFHPDASQQFYITFTSNYPSLRPQEIWCSQYLCVPDVIRPLWIKCRSIGSQCRLPLDQSVWQKRMTEKRLLLSSSDCHLSLFVTQQRSLRISECYTI